MQQANYTHNKQMPKQYLGTLTYNTIVLDLKAMGNSFQIVIKHRTQPNTWVQCVKCSQMMMKLVLNGSGRSTIHWKWKYRKYSGHNTINTVYRTRDMQWWAQRVGACKCFKLHPRADWWCLLTMETSIREEEGERLRNTNTNTSGTQIHYVKQHAVKTSSR